MSAFFFEDVVAFKADSSIVASVNCTWSDVDQDSSEGIGICFVHRTLPTKVKDAWFDEGRLLPGYVVVEFLQDYDGFCLVSEASLKLVDRSLAVGDVVKKHPSDAQSGTVISTSLMCSLVPTCSETVYNAKEISPAQGYIPTHGPGSLRHKYHHGHLSHGFPKTTHGRSPSLPDEQHVWSRPTLQVPAQELAHWSNYREEDFVIYRDWVGQIRSVYNEVTVRLTNGSVVVLEDPDELEEPYWIPGTASYELVQRLDRAGYYRSGNIIHVRRKPESLPAEPCFPGQHVRTKKGNLRRGRWTFGAYDPSVPPEGIVADVRPLGLEVRWLYPNQSLPLRSQANPPSSTLNLDDLGSGEIQVYNRSRLPVNPTVDRLPYASYSPDTGFGHRVRFRDIAGAAIKHGITPLDPDVSGSCVTDCSTPRLHYFNRIPRAATQGFDMNVLLVTSTSTKVMVRWQDCSVTEEDSVYLHAYLNPDEHDVWPGEKVSLKAEEEGLGGDSAGSVRAHKVGVVQSVDALARIAHVRWFQDAKIDMDEERLWQIHGSNYGKMGVDSTNVPLYDIAAYDALNATRGDLAIILPVLDSNYRPASNQLHSAIHTILGCPSNPPSANAAGSIEVARPAIESSSETQNYQPSVRGVEWFGEVTEVCLDGGVMIRLGAALEARDVKVPPERILIVPSDETESVSEDTDDEDVDNEAEENLGWSHDSHLYGEDTDNDLDPTTAMDISYEYEGGEKLNTDNDEEMWSTDEEDPNVPSLSPIAVCQENGDSREPDTRSAGSGKSGATDRAIFYAGYPSMPSQFAILDSSPPTDHHYFNSTRALTADLMRRIMKESEIMRNSLPDGVFVRSWASRLDLLRVLIVGPYDTPYEFAPFVIDLHYGASFPNSSPDAFFHSWTNNVGRINPNLYENGRICLSLLGTWDGDNRNEEWSSKKSTILQLIVSLMGLVLVKAPYYNEAGYDVLIGSAESQVPSALYSEKVYVMSKAFVKTALSQPPQGLESIIAWLYLEPSTEGPALLHRILDDSVTLLPNTRATAGSPRKTIVQEEPSAFPKLSAGALILLKRNLKSLVEPLKEYDQERYQAILHSLQIEDGSSSPVAQDSLS